MFITFGAKNHIFEGKKVKLFLLCTFIRYLRPRGMPKAAIFTTPKTIVQFTFEYQALEKEIRRHFLHRTKHSKLGQHCILETFRVEATKIYIKHNNFCLSAILPPFLLGFYRLSFLVGIEGMFM